MSPTPPSLPSSTSKPAKPFTPSLATTLNPKITFSNDYTLSSILPYARTPAYASLDCEEIIRQFRQIKASSKFRLVAEIPFEGKTFEPEGMVRIGEDRYYVSLGEFPERPVKHSPPGTLDADGYDRTPGKGTAHIVVFDGKGRRVADAEISVEGDAEYHTGGLEYDGEYLWATLSEYRPNSTATLVRIDPTTLAVEPVLRMSDHAGGVVRDPASGDVVTLSWGGRTAHRWNLGYRPMAPPGFTAPRAVVHNPSAWVDYQDAKWLGRSPQFGFKPLMMASGIADIGGAADAEEHGLLQPKVRIGGLAIVDCETMVPLVEVPVPLVTRKGHHMCKNPFDVGIVDGKLRLYFLPDEGESVLYVFEVDP